MSTACVCSYTLWPVQKCYSYILTTTIFNIYYSGCTYLNTLCIILKMLLCTSNVNNTILKSALQALKGAFVGALGLNLTLNTVKSVCFFFVTKVNVSYSVRL